MLQHPSSYEQWKVRVGLTALALLAIMGTISWQESAQAVNRVPADSSSYSGTPDRSSTPTLSPSGTAIQEPLTTPPIPEGGAPEKARQADEYAVPPREKKRVVPQNEKPSPRKVRIAQLPAGTPGETGTATIHLSEELSLQETLDRLGFTVNVPTVHKGITLHQWHRNYRTSSQSEAVSSEWFKGGGDVTFRMLGQQGSLAPNTSFGYTKSGSSNVTLMEPAGNHHGMWLSAGAGKTTKETISGIVRLYTDIDDSSGSFGSGTYFTTRQDNPHQTARAVVLPAKTGGTWVDEGSNTGRWEGGTSGGAYLICWEDWDDNDFQDIILLSRGLEPVDAPKNRLTGFSALKQAKDKLLSSLR